MTASAQTFLLESRRRLIHVIAQVLTLGCSSITVIMAGLVGVLPNQELIKSYLVILGLAFAGSATTLAFIRRLPLGLAMLPLVAALIGGVVLSSLLLPETALVSIPLLSVVVLMISLGQNRRLTFGVGLLCTLLSALLAGTIPWYSLAAEQSFGAALPAVYVVGTVTLIVVVWMVSSRLITTSHAAIQLADQRASNTNRAIDVALTQVGSFMGADSALLMQLTADRTAWQTTHSWHAPGQRSQPRLHTLPVSEVPLWTERLLSGNLLAIPRVARLGAQAELALLASRGVRAMVLAPIVVDDETIGCLCLAAGRAKPMWTSENQLLIIVARIIAQTLEYHRIQTALQASEMRYRLLAEHATDIIACHAPDGMTRYCSPATNTVLGKPTEELVGHLMWEHALPADQPALRATYRQLARHAGTMTMTYRAAHSDGSERWLETTAHAVKDRASGSVVEIVTVTRDVTMRRVREEQIAQLAFYDPLTGLANRHRFQADADTMLVDVTRRASSLALLYLDLDRFKLINDTMGHAAGDELLVHVAERLRADMRAGDVLARLGGDEFAVLLPDADESQAATVAQRLLDRFVQPFSVRGASVYVKASIGIACFPHDAARVEELLKHADIAMYRAKLEGGRYHHYEPHTDMLSSELFVLDAELHRAIDTDELLLHYQPIVDLHTGKVTGVEALVRWAHPQRGLLAPQAFIPMAEERGLIRSLDRWVLRTALEQMRAWGADAPPHIAVNLSMRSLNDHSLVSYVASCLQASRVAPSRLTLEITESAVMHDAGVTRQVLEGLQALGLRIALDDFGTEYASLRHLKALPVHVLKIDSTFVQGLGSDPGDEAIARAVLALGHGLRLDVIAEGVAYERQRTWLIEMGCRYAQGYGLGEPRPAEQIPARVADEARR